MLRIKELFWNAIYQNRGLDALIQIAADVLGNPTYLIDTSNCIAAACEQIRTADTYMRPYIERGVLPDDEIQLAKNWGMGKKIYSAASPFIAHQKILRQGRQDQLYSFIFSPVRLQGEAVAYFCCMNLNREFTDQDIQLATIATEAITIELQKSRAYQDNKGSELGYQLLRAISAQSQIYAPNSFSGWTAKEYSYIVYISKPSWHGAEEKPQNILLPVFRATLYDDIVARTKDGLVVLLSQSSPLKAASEKYKKLEELCSLHKLHAGYSQPLRTFSSCYQHYQEAQIAYQFGQRCPDTLITSYENSSVSHMLQIARDTVPPESLCFSGLLKLKAYDDKEHSDYCHTLHTYLSTLKDTAETCSQLAIHKNTLYYRLSKIKEIMDCDLNSMEDIVHIMLTYKIFELGLMGHM